MKVTQMRFLPLKVSNGTVFTLVMSSGPRPV